MKIDQAYPVNGAPPNQTQHKAGSASSATSNSSSNSVNDSKSAKTLVAGTPSPELERAIRDIIDNPILNRRDVWQPDKNEIWTSSKEHAEKMKQAGVKAHYVNDKVQREVHEWNERVFGMGISQGLDSNPRFLSMLKQVNQLEKKFGLDDFSLNFKLQNDKLVVNHPKLDNQLKTKLEDELNKNELGIKSNFKTLLNYTGKAAYRHLLETNGTTRFLKHDVEGANLTVFAAVVTERFEKTGKIELPPIKSPYGSNNLTHLTLQDFYSYKSDLKDMLRGDDWAKRFIEHFGNLYMQTTQYMLEHLDAKQYVLHDRFGYLNYKKEGSTVNETA